MDRLISFAVFALIPALAGAQVAAPCGWQARSDFIAEPWEDFTRTYANGDVRIALLDTIEPAAGSFHLLILHPPYSAMGDRNCTLISREVGVGYAGLFFSEITAGYDPAEGLVLTIPVIIYLPEENFQNSALVRVSINQATGDVAVAQKLGGE